MRASEILASSLMMWAAGTLAAASSARATDLSAGCLSTLPPHAAVNRSF
jgi:hypothetical protein